MDAFNIHTGRSYFVVTGWPCDALATVVIAGSNGIGLLMIGLVNFFDDFFSPISLELRKGHRN